MAENLLSIPAISAGLNVAFDTAVKEFLSYVRNRYCSTEISDPCTLQVKLRTTMLALSMVLDHAKAQYTANPALLKWLHELSDVMYDAEDLKDDIQTQALSSELMAQSAVMPVPNSDYDEVPITACDGDRLMRKKLVDICEKLDVFLPQINLFNLGKSLVEKARSHVCLPTPASLVDHEPALVGRNSERDEIISFFLEQKVEGMNNPNQRNMLVVAIVGDPGLGKTTLARMIFDDPRVNGLFDLNTWVSISSPAMMSTDRLTKAIFKSVTTRDAPDYHFKRLQAKLSRAVLGKSLLLVLEDIWEMEENLWDELLCPLRRTANCVVIIVTSSDFAAFRASAHKFRISPLSNEDCFSVLQSAAEIGGQELIDGALKETGRQIAVKCKGSPLAARLIGRSLGFMLNVEDWDAILGSDVWDLPNGKYKTPSALRLSYCCLPPPLRRCFAYCSIFPKNYEIQRERLVLSWVAEGFVQVSEGDACSLEEMGDRYFRELLCRSFFQPSISNTSHFVMHNLVHDLAQQASSDFCFTWDARNPQLPPSKIRHFSYIQTNDEDFEDFKAMDGYVGFKRLRTFMPLSSSPNSRYRLDEEEANDLLLKLTSLRVLSLSYYVITDLTPSLGGLKHLRLLDLRQTSIEHLPETVCTLYNLQTLLLCNCPFLTTLPEGLGSLVCLRHLDISGPNRLQNMPLQISKLNKISTLTNFVVGENRGAKISALRDFHSLRGHLTVSELRNTTSESDASSAKMKAKLYIDELTLNWGHQNQTPQKAKQVCHMLRPSTNLKRIAIQSYGGASFPNWVGDRAFAEIVSANLSDCSHCTCLPPLGQLPSLKQLYITNFFALETVGSEFYGNIQPFQALEILRLKDVPKWQMWSPFQGDGDPFPRLQELYLSNCPNLSGHLPVRLPSLVKLEIIKCGHLSGLLPQLPVVSRLKLQECPKLELMSITDLTTLISLDIQSPCSATPFEGLDLLNLASLTELRMEYTKTVQNCMVLAADESTHIQNQPERQAMLIGNSLRDLYIHSCAFYLACPATSLRSLSISRCKTLELNTCFSSLQSLDLSQCDSVESFPFQLFPMLIHLKIERCSRLREILLPERTELQCLYELSITSCNQLLHFPAQGLPAPKLTTFCISTCDRLEYLPRDMNSLLPSLRLLLITKCPVLKPPPADRLPPNLQVHIL